MYIMLGDQEGQRNQYDAPLVININWNQMRWMVLMLNSYISITTPFGLVELEGQETCILSRPCLQMFDHVRLANLHGCSTHFSTLSMN